MTKQWQYVPRNITVVNWMTKFHDFLTMNGYSHTREYEHKFEKISGIPKEHYLAYTAGVSVTDYRKGFAHYHNLPKRFTGHIIL